MSIDIPAENLSFVQTLVATKQYSSESAVVGAALTLMARSAEEFFQKEIAPAIAEIENGEGTELEIEEIPAFIQSIFDEADRELEAERSAQ